MLTRIALRNLFRNRRRSAITLAVIVFGAVGLILFGGYKALTFQGLRESTIRRIGHLQIHRAGYSAAESQKPLELGLENAEAIRAEVQRDPRVRDTAAQITLVGLAGNGDKSETYLATAVEPEKDRAARGYTLLAGAELPAGEQDAVLVGRGLAASLHVQPGQYLTLMTTTVTGSLNAMDVRVAGIVVTGVRDYDDRAIRMPIAGAQELLQTAKIEKLLVFLHRTADTSAVERDLARTFAAKKWTLEMTSWPQLASFYQQVVRLFNGIFGFLGVIVFGIVVFSVANTIVMSIFERTREIGTLLAIGTTRGRVWRMFFLEGLLTGAIGGLLGVAAGVAAAQLINAGDVMLPPPPGFTTGYPLRILIEGPVLASAFLISLVTATVSSILPALKASRLPIVDALGHI
jgi:putative ABC transport system permease protein